MPLPERCSLATSLYIFRGNDPVRNLNNDPPLCLPPPSSHPNLPFYNTTRPKSILKPPFAFSPPFCFNFCLRFLMRFYCAIQAAGVGSNSLLPRSPENHLHAARALRRLFLIYIRSFDCQLYFLPFLRSSVYLLEG